MKRLRIIVCIKVVPKSEEVRIDPETMTLLRNEARSEINPGDMNALETALNLKDRYGGDVRLVAMGAPLFEPYLRVAMAMGADEAHLLSDRAFAGADTLATSCVLAAGIAKMDDFDLVVCGEESSDGATGQVPAGIAEWLHIPQVAYATAVSLGDGPRPLLTKRELHGGHETLESPIPALISVAARANEPRFMDMGRRTWALEAPITTWGAEDLAIEKEWVGLRGSPTEVAGTKEAAKRERQRRLLDGTAEQQARFVVERVIQPSQSAHPN